MKKWNLVIDVENCNNCHMCSLACKDEFVGNSFPGYSAEMPKRGADWIKMNKKERGQTPMIDIGYIPTMCQHCDDAPCMKAAKNGAVTKRNDGIIIIDPEKSKGQKQIVESCPHGSISWNEELEIPQIWFFDAHLLEDEHAQLQHMNNFATFRDRFGCMKFHTFRYYGPVTAAVRERVAKHPFQFYQTVAELRR